jgi:hypothetical protein
MHKVNVEGVEDMLFWQQRIVSKVQVHTSRISRTIGVAQTYVGMENSYIIMVSIRITSKGYSTS